MNTTVLFVHGMHPGLANNELDDLQDELTGIVDEVLNPESKRDAEPVSVFFPSDLVGVMQPDIAVRIELCTDHAPESSIRNQLVGGIGTIMEIRAHARSKNAKVHVFLSVHHASECWSSKPDEES